MTMRAEGKGPTGEKIARWINKVLVGGFAQLIHAGRGIAVASAKGNKGVTISTNAPLMQWFWLTDDIDLTDTDPQHAHTRTGRAVNVGHVDGEGGSSQFDSPPTSTPEADIYFSFAKGWFPIGSVVLCTDVTGRWEVVNDGIHSIEGEVNSSGGGFINVTLAWGGGVNANLIPFGTITAVDCVDRWGYAPTTGDSVGARFSDAFGQFFIDAKEC